MKPNPKSATEVSVEERLEDYEMRWRSGGLCFYSSFADLFTNQEANDTLADFIREKTKARVNDPETGRVTAAKRLSHNGQAALRGH